ncbi:MAG: hypothetical protein IKU34_10420 [Clostridia bacterium]|nr:hypothetical protein [Clostridia bacterium]
MKCKLTEKKNMTIMLIVGLVMIVVGLVAALLLPEEAHALTKAAGVINGMGFALAVMSGAVLLRRKRLGEARANDSELAMSDERGVMIAYKAQSVTAIVAIIGIVVILLTALFRGDTLYMIMGTVMCFVIAAVKFGALQIFNKMM